MDKRKQRTHAKRDRITRVAMTLFATRGMDKVTVEEIAEKANVSKVTLYKYFGTKDDLYAEVVRMFIEDTLSATEAMFNSNLAFLEKLKYALLMKVNTSPLVNWSYLLQVWDQGSQTSQTMYQGLHQRVKALIYQVFEEGKREGFIEESLSFDLFYLYSEIFREGLKAKSIDFESVLVNKEAIEKLVELHFFGLIKRR